MRVRAHPASDRAGGPGGVPGVPARYARPATGAPCAPRHTGALSPQASSPVARAALHRCAPGRTRSRLITCTAAAVRARTCSTSNASSRWWPGSSLASTPRAWRTDRRASALQTARHRLAPASCFARTCSQQSSYESQLTCNCVQKDYSTPLARQGCCSHVRSRTCLGR